MFLFKVYQYFSRITTFVFLLKIYISFEWPTPVLFFSQFSSLQWDLVEYEAFMYSSVCIFYPTMNFQGIYGNRWVKKQNMYKKGGFLKTEKKSVF